MNGEGQVKSRKVKATSNIYTAILAITFCVVLATVAYAAWKGYVQYGIMFKIP